MTTIYILIDPRNKQVRYVGKAVDLKRRIQNHLCPAQLAKKTHKAVWLKNLVNEGLKPIVEVLEVLVENWEEAERKWIAFYKEKGCDLTNYTLGGEGGYTSDRTGSKWSDEQREKYRASRLGKKVSSPSHETLEKRGKAIKVAWERRRILGTDKGIWNHDDKAKAQLREKHTGKTLSEEHKQKLSDSLKGRTSPRKGKKMSFEQRQKLSIASKGRSSPMKGRKHSEESKRKMSEAKLRKNNE